MSTHNINIRLHSSLKAEMGQTPLSFLQQISTVLKTILDDAVQNFALFKAQ